MGEKRRKTFKHPLTPKKEEGISKRFWDAKVRAWRRSLHLWDEDGSAYIACIERRQQRKPLFALSKNSANSTGAGKRNNNYDKKNKSSKTTKNTKRRVSL